jgi:hypothetical protein
MVLKMSTSLIMTKIINQKNKKNQKIKESKRLKFNKEFNGVEMP